MAHVVWDWNGTLFADQHVVVGAVNRIMQPRGRPGVTHDDYQAHYTRPVRVFYERLLSRPIDDDEWASIDDEYHDAYHDLLHQAGLDHQAQWAMDHLADQGHGQSLLSMYRHDNLLPLIERFGIGDRFVRIDGLQGEGGGHKAPHLHAHLRALEADGHRADDILLIGDAVDDAVAAAEVGVAAVLYDGGSHPHEELLQAGVPVVTSLREAVSFLS